MRWTDLEREAPRLAARARELVVAPGVCLVATVRRDASPRLSPVEPLLLDGDLWLSMMWNSRKAIDLVADDRISGTQRRDRPRGQRRRGQGSRPRGADRGRAAAASL